MVVGGTTVGGFLPTMIAETPVSLSAGHRQFKPKQQIAGLRTGTNLSTRVRQMPLPHTLDEQAYSLYECPRKQRDPIARAVVSI